VLVPQGAAPGLSTFIAHALQMFCWFADPCVVVPVCVKEGAWPLLQPSVQQAFKAVLGRGAHAHNKHRALFAGALSVRVL